ncbi:MAG: CDP-alcohol phosphatidyltransferase family protein [Pseudomonadota bacterium]
MSTPLRWIPNAISLARISLVPMVIASIAEERYQMGVSLFFIAGFSDGIDGWLARRFNWRSELGAILDPIADKLLLIGTFGVLAWIGLVPAWFAFLVIARDLLIMGGAITYHFLYGDLEGRPSNVSKLNTVLLLLYVVSVLLLQTGLIALPGDWAVWATQSLMWALLATMAISTAGYVIEWVRRAKEHSA